MNKLFPHHKILKAVLLLGCSFFFSCENDPKDVAIAGTGPMLEEARQVEALLSQDGRARAMLKAPFMLRYNADTTYTEFPKTLHVDFFDSSGRVESQLRSLYGKYFETRNKVYLRDSVLVFNNKGDSLKSPDLWWDQNTGKFYTDKEVWLRTKDFVIYRGKGFEADQDLSGWAIFEPYGLIAVPDSMMVD
ncbi:MAG: LPS export ABC transporter periplasmic protein LptC [Flavisolibacter sp.]